MRALVRRCCVGSAVVLLHSLVIVIAVLSTTLASGQYATTFDALLGDADGETLVGQDSYYNPVPATSVPALVYTYAGNVLGVPVNPTGGDKFAAGVGPGGSVFMRTQRDLAFGAGTGIWSISYDVSVSFIGTLPTAQNAGSVSTQTFPGDKTFIALSTWTDITTAAAWNADYVWFNATGTQLQEIVPDPAFQNLVANQWYRRTTIFSLDTYQILEVRITDLTTAITTSYSPPDRYLFGGTAFAPPCDGYRIFAGAATVAGNVVAYDNVVIEQIIPLCAPIASLVCSVDCGAGTVALSWPGGAYTAIEVERDTILISTLPGGATGFVDNPGVSGSYSYLVRGICAGGPALSGPVCNAEIAIGGVQENIIWAGESAAQIDSVAALDAAMTAAGLAHTVVADLGNLPCGATLTPSNRVWGAMGSFPSNHPISVAEGMLLRDHVLAGGHVYMEGGDIWGFDPATAFNTVDGIASPAVDGGDDFTAMVGSSYDDAQFAGLNAAYNQDQAGNDWTDQIAATATDMAGPNAGVVWNRDVGGGVAGYGTGVFHASDQPFGRVLNQSWEFGGYGGDQNALILAYDDALRRVGSPSDLTCSQVGTTGSVDLAWTNPQNYDSVNVYVDGPLYTTLGPQAAGSASATISGLSVPGAHTICIQGVVAGELSRQVCCMVTLVAPPVDLIKVADINGDGAVNVADPINILSELFPPMPGPSGGFITLAGCPAGFDCNGDNMVNIADPIFLLSWLFSMGPPPPAWLGTVPACNPASPILGCLFPPTSCD
ncbi:MAG: hypothetical protein ACKVX7_00885 [Planctomycetota bacterium]